MLFVALHNADHRDDLFRVELRAGLEYDLPTSLGFRLEQAGLVERLDKRDGKDASSMPREDKCLRGAPANKSCTH